MLRKPTIGLSIDVELDGPSILKNSCLQLGVCAFYHHTQYPNPNIMDEWIVDKREWSIIPQKNKEADPRTMNFLLNHPELLAYIALKAQDVEQVVGEFCLWYTELQSRYDISIILASPAAIDYPWLTNLVACYRPSYIPDIELPFSCRCLTTMMNQAEKFNGIDTRSAASPLRQHSFPEKSHYALDDSIRQCWVYLTLKSLLRDHKNDYNRMKFAEQQQQQPSMLSLQLYQPLSVSYNNLIMATDVMSGSEDASDSDDASGSDQEE